MLHFTRQNRSYEVVSNGLNIPDVGMERVYSEGYHVVLFLCSAKVGYLSGSSPVMLHLFSSLLILESKQECPHLIFCSPQLQ